MELCNWTYVHFFDVQVLPLPSSSALFRACKHAVFLSNK